MHAVQQGLAGSAFTDVMGVPAWKSLPSGYLVATQDEAIPPNAERMFAGRMDGSRSLCQGARVRGQLRTRLSLATAVHADNRPSAAATIRSE